MDAAHSAEAGAFLFGVPFGVNDAKHRMRTEALARLKSQPTTADESLSIALLIVDLPELTGAHCVALFAPLLGEPDPAMIWTASHGKRIVCAAMGEQGPELREATRRSSMVRTPRGFFEPPASDPVAPEEVDLWIVPGLAFDAHGVRLGRGGGYYDRLLARRGADALVIGVAPARSVVELLPREPHDAAVDRLATEAGWRPLR